MIVTEFYDRLRGIYDRRALRVAMFVNPLHNHGDFPNVQFIYPTGAVCPPLNSKADQIVVADPLAGPFYQLTVEGLSVKRRDGSEYVSARVVVCLPNGRLGTSWAIGIKDTASNIKKKLSDLIDNQWYEIDTDASPWVFRLTDGSSVQ